MKISEFNYNLPNELIATHPAEPRDSAKLLALDRESGEIADKQFTRLPEILKAGDVLVFNDSKVIPARLHAVIASAARQSNSRKFEVLLVKNIEGSTWECWIKPGRKAKLGDIFTFSEKLTAQLLRREEDIFVLKFNLVSSDFFAELGKIGEMPVPPYIVKAREIKTRNSKLVTLSSGDDSDYQTVYARTEGSVAAPTAGLHFTDDLLMRLREKGIQLEYVTLHVGLGTFQPVSTDVVEEFQIHSEYYEISQETANRLNDAKHQGRRIIAVGTTSVRVLESASIPSLSSLVANPGISLGPSKGYTRVRSSSLGDEVSLTSPFDRTHGLRESNDKDDKYHLQPFTGETKIFIYPGYKFKFVDGIITNFHLPKSSLLLLVSAFAGKENILSAYNHAVENGYRFYSYGDAMVII